MYPFKVLCIGGSDSSAGAGIQADLKTVSACGCYGMSVITAVTAQNTLGVQAVSAITPDFVERQMESVLADIGADAVKTGMLLTGGIVSVVAGKIKKYQIERLIVDPVMLAKGGRSLLLAKARRTLVEKLLPLTLVVTPNIPEAEKLAGVEIKSVAGMKKAAFLIRKLGVQNVIIKGGHQPVRKKSEVVDILYAGGKYYEYCAPWLDIKDTHGTGCTYASALAANLAMGENLIDAAGLANFTVRQAIENSLRLGHGCGPVHTAVLKESPHECLCELQKAVQILSQSQCGKLIPEVQSNLVYAKNDATSSNQVAGFPGRIIRFREMVRILSHPEFGASQHIARVVLTALKFHPTCRSAMNIRYSEKIISVCRRVGFAVASFDRSEEPVTQRNKEGLSLEWGVNKILRQTKNIPDIIYDRGGWAKEPMVRVLGRNPVEVVNKVLKILKHYK